jgi:hypothetical protein
MNSIKTYKCRNRVWASLKNKNIKAPTTLTKTHDCYFSSQAIMLVSQESVKMDVHE